MQKRCTFDGTDQHIRSHFIERTRNRSLNTTTYKLNFKHLQCPNKKKKKPLLQYLRFKHLVYHSKKKKKSHHITSDSSISYFTINKKKKRSKKSHRREIGNLLFIRRFQILRNSKTKTKMHKKNRSPTAVPDLQHGKQIRKITK